MIWLFQYVDSRSTAVFFVLLLTTVSHAAIEIRFGEDEYVVPAAGPFQVNVVLDADDSTSRLDPLPQGLFSLGLRIRFGQQHSRPTDGSPVTVPAELDYYGFDAGVLQQAFPESVSYAANIDLDSEPLEPYQGTQLGTVSLQNLATPGSTYKLELDLFRALGPTESVVLDGDGNVLDPDLQFGSTTIQVAPTRDGDFNSDGTLSVEDIDLLCLHTRDADQRTEFDLNQDAKVDRADVKIWIEEIKNTYFGDANLDGVFSSRDLVTVFQAGEYEDRFQNNSTWADGDWNCDQDFTTGDLVTAFQTGGYERGPRPKAPAAATRGSTVPEPSSMLLLCVGFGSLLSFRQVRSRTAHGMPSRLPFTNSGACVSRVTTNVTTNVTTHTITHTITHTTAGA